MTSKKIFFLGDKFSFHHIAALSYFGHENTFLNEATFDEIIEKIKQTENSFGIIAVENTLAGEVEGNYEKICNSGLNIHGNITIPVELNLAAKSDMPLSLIKMVYSHEMAFKETSNFFNETPHILFNYTSSTASAVKFIAESSESGIAAIGNKAAIEYYGLHMIAEKIDNHSENYTRFIILSNQMSATDTTNSPLSASILLQTEANLTGILNEFSATLTTKKQLNNGCFYIESNKMLPKQLFNLLRKICQNDAGARVLGIY